MVLTRFMLPAGMGRRQYRHERSDDLDRARARFRCLAARSLESPPGDCPLQRGPAIEAGVTIHGSVPRAV